MKKCIYAGVAGCTCLFLAWAAGFNFDERGFNSFMVAYVTIAFTGVGFLLGGIE